MYKGLKTSTELNKIKEKECIGKYLNLIFINDIPLKKSFEKLEVSKDGYISRNDLENGINSFSLQISEYEIHIIANILGLKTKIDKIN